jgi:ankyrin repeat protein
LLGCDDVVQYLIDKQVDVDTTDEFGNTPLHYGAYSNFQLGLY